MHLTATTIVVIIAILIVAVIAIAFEMVCRWADRRIAGEFAAAGVPYEARHDRTTARGLMPDDPFDWAETRALVDRERERLASTGELRALYEKPYPPARLADTGELRALAYDGDTAALEADTAAYLDSLEDI
jgi:hypothetical protein